MKNFIKLKLKMLGESYVEKIKEIQKDIEQKYNLGLEDDNDEINYDSFYEDVDAILNIDHIIMLNQASNDKDTIVRTTMGDYTSSENIKTIEEKIKESFNDN